MRLWGLIDRRQININITPHDFQYYWRQAYKKTSSSYSGLHFGHYRAAAFSHKLSQLHAL